MLGIQPSFREDNHLGSEHSILLPYYQQPVDANTSEQEQEQQKQQQQQQQQEQQRVQTIQAYFQDVYDVEQKIADARAHMDALKPKYNNDQKKYSQDPEYQKYHKIMGDIIEGPYWNTDFAVKRYQYYYALDPNSEDTKQALRQANAVAKENAAKKAEDDWQKNKWKYIGIGAAILAASFAIPYAGEIIGGTVGSALLGTVLGEAAAADTIAIGAIDTGLTYAAAASETGGFLGSVGGNAAVGAAASAAFGGSQKEIREGAIIGALGGAIGMGTGIIGRTAAESLDVAGFLSSSAYMNEIQRGVIAGTIGGGFGAAFGAAAGASGIPGLSTKEGAKQGAIWGGTTGLFYGERKPSIKARKAKLGATEARYNNNLPPLPLVREYKYDILQKASNDKKYIVDFDGMTKSLPGYNNPNASGGWEETKSSFEIPMETVVGNNFDPITPLPYEPTLNAEDLQVQDALQNISPMELFPPSPNTQETFLNSGHIIPDQDEGGLIMFTPRVQHPRLSNESTPEVNPLAPEYREMTPAPVEFDTPESTNITNRERDRRGLPYSHQSTTRKRYSRNFGYKAFR